MKLSSSYILTGQRPPPHPSKKALKYLTSELHQLHSVLADSVPGKAVDTGIFSHQMAGASRLVELGDRQTK